LSIEELGTPNLLLPPPIKAVAVAWTLLSTLFAGEMEEILL
jgi:hypothetical protein